MEDFSESPGYIDEVSSTMIGGWIRSHLKGNTLVAEVDGVRQQLRPRFISRSDLTAAGVDGIGFEAYFQSEEETFELRVGLIDAEDSVAGPAYFLSYSSTGEDCRTVHDPSPNLAVMTGEDINTILNAVDPDSPHYTTLMQRFGHVRGVTRAPVEVLFLDGTGQSVSIRYRILNIAQGLQELGYSTRCVSLDRTQRGDILVMKPRIAVFFRAILDDHCAEIVETFRSKGVQIVYDFDDLIIDPSIITDIDGVRYLSHEDTVNYAAGMLLYRRFAEVADIVTTSTPYLSAYAERILGRRVHTIRNTIGRTLLKAYAGDPDFDAIVGEDRFNIGYYSGTRTHQKDFAQAAGAIVRLMATYPAIRLRVVGQLDLAEFPNLQKFVDRIDMIGFMPYHQMVADITNCDVVIAPLDHGDPFCEAKSELKFFEAALRGRLCVASPTQVYRDAMHNGTLGFLATTPEDWFRALERIYVENTLRYDMVMAARHHVMRYYSYLEAAKVAESLYFSINRPAQPVVTIPPVRKLVGTASIGMIINDIAPGSGGMRKILTIGRHLAEAGFQISLYVDSSLAVERLRRAMQRYYFDFDCEIRNFRGIVGNHDAIICTYWKTAYAMRNHPHPERIFYFVQDFEPMFEAVSTQYVQMLATYSLGFNILTFGQWVHDRLLSELGVASTRIPMTVDRGVYQALQDGRKTYDVLFYARPSQPRRCYELGVAALRLLRRRNPALRVAFYGEVTYPDAGFEFDNLGAINDLDVLARTYRRAKLGMCFSTTNPSLVGYEMLASGLPVVDLKVPGWEKNFGGDNFVYYAQPTEEAVAGRLADALSNQFERETRIDRGIEFISRMPDDRILGEVTLAAISAKLGLRQKAA